MAVCRVRTVLFLTAYAVRTLGRARYLQEEEGKKRERKEEKRRKEREKRKRKNHLDPLWLPMTNRTAHTARTLHTADRDKATHAPRHSMPFCQIYQDQQVQAGLAEVLRVLYYGSALLQPARGQQTVSIRTESKPNLPPRLPRRSVQRVRYIVCPKTQPGLAWPGLAVAVAVALAVTLAVWPGAAAHSSSVGIYGR
ncbi:hypothetical protein LY76DRAFT_410795 [Colletotrichum caudatum]|nr:hypothetical protein LY76DRAFT_410795 [Colletotrichum caudatum]